MEDLKTTGAKEAMSFPRIIGLAADDVNGCVWDLEIIKDLLEDDLGTIDKTRVVDLAIETVINTLKKIGNDLADYSRRIEE